MDTDRMLHKPLSGGIFGYGRYALASMPCVSQGLHAIRYMVVEPRAGAVLSVADDKVGALADARRLIAAVSDAEAVERGPEQLELSLAHAPQEPEPYRPGRAVSRRRRDIFERANGKCHYCAAALTLDGTWHVEHMMPRALGGADDLSNLVAACAPCNQEKADMTAIEFLARAG